MECKHIRGMLDFHAFRPRRSPFPNVLTVLQKLPWLALATHPTRVQFIIESQASDLKRARSYGTLRTVGLSVHRFLVYNAYADAFLAMTEFES